jgi:protein-S-isoprenylcysteine O-methyltransferase Ste14
MTAWEHGMSLESAERLIRAVGAVVGLGTLTYAIVGILRSLRRPSGREERGARFALRIPIILFATFLFIVIGALLWRPLPIGDRTWSAAIFLALGSLFFFGGLLLYLWGMRTLGAMFGPSTGFAVRLQAEHQLIVSGPYARVRHPMYLAVMATAIGSLLLYRTWATLLFAIGMFGLLVRARREEKVLEKEFGAIWQAYAARVPQWLPRLQRR